MKFRPGDRVSVTDDTHPRRGRAGVVTMSQQPRPDDPASPELTEVQLDGDPAHTATAFLAPMLTAEKR